MKKVLIIATIIAIVFGFLKIKEWYTQRESERINLLEQNLNFQQRVQEDSLTKAVQVVEIKNQKTLNGKLSKNIKDVQNKYNSTLESFHELQLKIDSLKSDHDTIYVEPDTSDSTILNFKDTMGNGFFDVYGKINTDPIYVFGLGINQRKPVIIQVTMEKLPGGKYVAYTYTNFQDLQVVNTPVRVIDKTRWIDQISFTAHVSAIKFGAGVGLMYGDYGLSFMQFTDTVALLFNYRKNIGELF